MGSQPKFCGACGSALAQGAKFCGECGWKISTPEAANTQNDSGMAEAVQAVPIIPRVAEPKKPPSAPASPVAQAPVPDTSGAHIKQETSPESVRTPSVPATPDTVIGSVISWGLV